MDAIIRSSASHMRPGQEIQSNRLKSFHIEEERISVHIAVMLTSLTVKVRGDEF